MRELIASVGDDDPGAVAWFTVIDRFDAAMSENRDRKVLVKLAADVLGLETGVTDDWHGLEYYEGPHPDSALERSALISRELTTRRHRGRNSIELQVGPDSFLACNIEIAQGRAGIAWAMQSGEKSSWRPLDYLVVERLAMASGQLALVERSTRVAEYRVEANNLALLLAGDQSQTEFKESVKQIGVQPELAHVVIAIDQEPAGVIHPDAILSAIRRLATRHRVGIHTAAIGKVLAAVAIDTADIDHFLLDLSTVFERSGVTLLLGVSSPFDAEKFHLGWEQAKTALALRSMATNGPIAKIGDLGALSLLASIPAEQVTSMPLFSKLEEALASSERPSNRDVLEAYLEENSLRKAASRVFLHHTSVERRLQRLSERLQLDLSQPDTRFQLLLLLKTRRVLEMQDTAKL